MSTTTRFQPVLVGALVMGVLSSLPLISAGNICCCLWVIGGGVAAAYVLQQGQPDPITPADGAFVGFLAGLGGAVVYLVISVPINILIGPMEREIMQRIVENIGGAENLRGYADRTELSATVLAVFGFVVMLFVGAVFSTIGGILGALMFKKQPVSST